MTLSLLRNIQILRFRSPSVVLAVLICGISLLYSHARQWVGCGLQQHAIVDLMADADRKFAELISRQANTSRDAIRFYHSKRGWTPPDGFTEWLRLAQEYGAILIEDFWDPIYEDLAPFWNMHPFRIRDLARQMTHGEQSNNVDGFWVRDNEPGTDCQEDFCLWFLELLRQLVGDGAVLPDVDIPVNLLITPRVIPPWEAMQPEPMSTTTSAQAEVLWLGPDADFGRIFREACPPNTLARGQDSRGSSSQTRHHCHNLSVSMEHTEPHMYQGFVRDFGLSQSPCHQPDLLHLHSSFFSPQLPNPTTTLAPCFSSQRVGRLSREIRIPAQVYWEESPLYHSLDGAQAGQDPGPDDWAAKTSKLFWRGGNTGGPFDSEDWKCNHRHRFVALTNATEIGLVNSKGSCRLPWAMAADACALARGGPSGLHDLASRNFDVGFFALGCSKERNSNCSYLDERFQTVPPVPLARVQKNKYLMDIDGNGLSGRFRSFMMSTSVPLKATVIQEWHDGRLIPWKHFIPIDNRYHDLWGVLSYFMPGCMSEQDKTRCPHQEDREEEAMKIGLEGATWARKVLRKEDMKLYMYRLLLEYGRLWNGHNETTYH